MGGFMVVYLCVHECKQFDAQFPDICRVGESARLHLRHLINQRNVSLTTILYFLSRLRQQ